MAKVGDAFEKSVELPDTSEKIYYKVGAAVTLCHFVSIICGSPPVLPHERFGNAWPRSQVAMCDSHQLPMRGSRHGRQVNRVRVLRCCTAQCALLPGATCPKTCQQPAKLGPPSFLPILRLQVTSAAGGRGPDHIYKWPPFTTHLRITTIELPPKLQLLSSRLPKWSLAAPAHHSYRKQIVQLTAHPAIHEPYYGIPGLHLIRTRTRLRTTCGSSYT